MPSSGGERHPAVPPPTAEVQHRQVYQRLLESTRSLYGALRRISGERQADRSAVLQRTAALQTTAEMVAAQGRTVDALRVLDVAYSETRAALAELLASADAARPAADVRPVAVAQAVHDSFQRAFPTDYTARRDTARALRDALVRIADEKDDAPARGEVALVDRLLGRADALLAAEDPRQARAVLDHAYLRIKLQIERLRGGETLVHPLHFANAEAEYRYARDRSEAFRLLIPLLVPEGDRGPAVQAHLERGRQLAEVAAAAANRSQFAAAIRGADAAAGAYQEALRSAGVVLPI